MKKYGTAIRGFVICTVLILLACNKKDDTLKFVSVSGRVWDDNKQAPVPDFWVYLYDIKCENWACHYNKVLDSAQTDADGYYAIRYKPQNSNSLRLSREWFDNRYVVIQPHDEIYIVEKGENTADFTVRRTSVMRTRVLIKNNPFLPLKTHDNIQLFPPEIPGTDNDTIVYLYGLPNRTNLIDLSVFEPGGAFYRKRTDSIALNGFADTFNITITAEPITFPRFKY